MTFDEWFDAAEERCAKATKPPWKAVKDRLSDDPEDVVISVCFTGGTHSEDCVGIPENHCHGCIVVDPPEKDADFIAHAREDLPKALAMLKKYREALEEALKIHWCRDDLDAMLKEALKEHPDE